MDMTAAILEALRKLTTRVNRLETLETGERITRGVITDYDRLTHTATVEVGSTAYAGVMVSHALGPWLLQAAALAQSAVLIAGHNTTTPALGIILAVAGGLPVDPFHPNAGHMHRGLVDDAPLLDTFAPVYNDIYIPLAGAKVPAVNDPAWATFTANLNAYTFAVDDYADLATAEALHGWKEGTALEVHVHMVTNGANDATARTVKFTAYYSIGDTDEVMSAENSLTAERAIAANLADKTHLYLSLGTISGAGYKLGANVKLRIRRIASTGTEPASDPFVEMVGIHYQVDALGSRQQAIK